VLSCGFVCVILCLAVLVEHRLVTDTDRRRRTQDYSIYRASIASRSKKQTKIQNIELFNLMAACVLAVHGNKGGPVPFCPSRPI